MKPKYFKAIFLFFYISSLCAAGQKTIVQILNDSAEGNLLYVTGDNNLYCTAVDDYQDDIFSKKKKIDLFEEDTPEPVKDRVILIGQPMKIEGTWTMPAVIKRKGLFDRLFRPDLCIIKQVTDENIPKRNSYIITKLADGHRTKVTKVGLLDTQVGDDTYASLISGSEWPTVKVNDIDNPFPDYQYDKKDTYLIDIIKNNRQITTQVEKSWLARNTFTFKNIIIDGSETTSFEDKKIPVQLSYLPTIFFDPTKELTNDFITQIFENYLLAAQKEKDWAHSTCFVSSDYAIIFSLHRKKYIIYKKDAKTEQLNFATSKIIDIQVGKDIIITACAFDFSSQTLFYATYDKKQNKASIEKDNTFSRKLEQFKEEKIIKKAKLY